ncbi:hypothetical protein TrLO_g2403 [Triparma laevis f. longispina]|uniref:Beta-amylase n=1 Tax=Triparma laevis f. longispina TaxID=1714387 RepID=A0A9W7KY86_9STRA|nr:hypothetical protein TrLO_g2403 [Triparma laevis f. longispina]
MTSRLEGTYATLWLQQVHSWFDSDIDRLAEFVSESKAAGFEGIMTDVPWSWTEREREGDVDFKSFSKDWMGEVCKQGLKLHIVLRVNELPPWIPENELDELSERGFEKREICNEVFKSTSMGSTRAMKMVNQFVAKSIEFYTSEYGDCVESFSPTLNNELETRYTQERDCMRDFNHGMLLKFEKWQQDRNFESVIEPVDYRLQCSPIVTVELQRWWDFRNDVLAEVYGNLCGLVSNANRRCLLHIGEFFSSTDRINGNAISSLLAMPQVTDLTMDSNMALWGGPVSPSVVGILIDASRKAGKIIHYEAATERIFPCDDHGKIAHNEEGAGILAAAKLMYNEAINRALESGVDALGFTNLCEPSFISEFLPGEGKTELLSLRSARSPEIHPTAIIYLPFRIFAAVDRQIAGVESIDGVKCDRPALPCWHPSFSKLPKFGYGLKLLDGCAQDIYQFKLMEVWDSLRLRHERVSIVIEAEGLDDEQLLSEVKEIVHINIKGVPSEFSERGLIKESIKERFISVTL